MKNIQSFVEFTNEKRELNEAKLSSEAFDRASGIIGQKVLHAFRTAAVNIAAILENDGFSKDEIKQFLTEEATSFVR